jgi:hypothetical protein
MDLLELPGDVQRLAEQFRQQQEEAEERARTLMERRAALAHAVRVSWWQEGRHHS